MDLLGMSIWTYSKLLGAEESSKAGVKRKRLGGSEGWVAARRVLEQTAVDIPPAR